MSLKYPVRALNYPEVKALSEPATAGQPEVIPWVYFDTQDFVTNWTRVSFFANPQNDPTLGNIEQGGTMPADTYFQVFSFNVDFLVSSVVTAATPTQVNDLLQIMNGARATLQFTIANKNYGPLPLSFCHSSGGIKATLSQSEAALAGIFNYGQNADPDGGWWVDGAVILPPRQSFSITVIGVAAALTATRSVRFSMAGVKYRSVR